MTEGAIGRFRRKNCYWEPTYNPELVGKMVDTPWNFVGAKGPEHCFFHGESFEESLKNGAPRKETNIVFRECDFQGFFEPESQYVFEKCHFIKCDLSLTTWKNIKFSKCKFIESSIGQTRFENCEFRDCNWEKTGFSPNETEFVRCLVSNAEECVNSAYTNLDKEVLSTRNILPLYQKMKLQGTKSTIARMLLRNHQEIGDENTFYRTVKTFEKRQSIAKIYESFYGVMYEKWLLKPFYLIKTLSWLLEILFIVVFGALNGWGASISRPLIWLIIVAAVFACVYSGMSSSLEVSAYQRAFDIGILAGYTNYGAEKCVFARIAQSIHLALSVVLYTVFFATAAARFSRVR